MIIGNGLIASVCRQHFGDNPNVIVFASGVSNSRENRSEAFLREKLMLIEALHRQKMILYFSTCSIEDYELRNTAYVMHKIEMETLVQSAADYHIFRLPQVVGKTPNPNTLTNFICQNIVDGTHFLVWRHAKRNLIDIEDVASICSYLVQSSHANRKIINIATPFDLYVTELVTIFEIVLGIKANYSLVEAGGTSLIESSMALDAATKIGINFSNEYIEGLIRKYYGK